MTKANNIQSYTEAVHTVWAEVSGAELVVMSGGRYRPTRITVKYDWRTQLSDKAWGVRSLVLSGPWVASDGVTESGAGTGSLQFFLSDAPEWAREFVKAHAPKVALTVP
jgi:hypothetical protein